MSWRYVRPGMTATLSPFADYAPTCSQSWSEPDRVESPTLGTNHGGVAVVAAHGLMVRVISERLDTAHANTDQHVAVITSRVWSPSRIDP